MEICKMCGGKQEKLCKAHLLPDGVKKLIVNFEKSGDHFLKASTVKSTVKIKPFKAQTLDFDNKILCSECDNIFGQYDNELIKMLRNWQNCEKRTVNSVRNLQILSVNGSSKKILLGIAGIILRFSYSNRFKKISLGEKYEKKFGQWVNQGDLDYTANNEFSAKIIGFPKVKGGIENVLENAPRVSRCNFSHYYSFILPGVSIFTKVGKGSWPDVFSEYPSLSHSASSIKIPLIPFEGSPHQNMLKLIARNS